MAILKGTAGKDQLVGTGAADTIYGLAGNDTLLGNLGDDVILGGDGNDRIYGEEGNDDLRGGAGNDRIFGGLGNDKLVGGGGRDVLDGGVGNDTMLGGAGNDLYFVDSIGDVVDEGTNLDTGDQVNTSLLFNDLNVLGGGQIENAKALGTGDVAILGNSADNILIGNAGSNYFLGNAGDDTIKTGAGNDFLDGGAGIDFMKGGAGNDTYVVDDINDVIDEGTNTDTADQVWSSIDVALEFANFGGGAVENVYLTGSANLTATGTVANNYMIGNSGNNILSGYIGNDTLLGGNGNDTLIGGEGNDTLYGGDGNDKLTGGPGSDVMYGGAGKDTFNYFLVDHVGAVDTINGYSYTDDVIDLSAIINIQAGDDIYDYVKYTPDGSGGQYFALDTNGSTGGANYVNFIHMPDYGSFAKFQVDGVTYSV